MARNAIVDRLSRDLLVLDRDILPEGVDCELIELSDEEAEKIAGNNRYTVDAAGTVTAIPVPPSAAEVERAANLARVRALAQSAVGVLLQDLTAVQVKALLAVLLWSAGAFDADGRVRALDEWAR